MLRVFWETLRERKWPVLIYCVASLLFLLLYVSLYPSLQAQSQQLADVMKSFPPSLMKALGVPADQITNFTLEGLLASKQFSFIFQAVAAILAISIAGNDIAGEIEKGTIEFQLSQPISRLKFFFARFCSGSLLLVVFCFVSTVLVIPMAKSYNVVYDAPVYWRLFGIASLFSIAVYSFSYFLSAISSTKGRVFGIAGGLITLMYIAFIVSALKDSLDKVKYLSFFYYFGADVIYQGVTSVAILVFTLTIILFLLLGALIFEERDLTT